jgi:hypothetical protein
MSGYRVRLEDEDIEELLSAGYSIDVLEEAGIIQGEVQSTRPRKPHKLSAEELQAIQTWIDTCTEIPF